MRQMHDHMDFKISTRQIQVRWWILKGMGDGTLIGLLDFTAKPRNWATSDQPFLDLRRAQESFIRR